MSELSPRASALLEAARRAPRAPSREAVQRMERAVMIATGVTAGAAGAGAAKTLSVWALSTTGKSVLGLVALTLAGTAVTVALVAKGPPLPAEERVGERADSPAVIVAPREEQPVSPPPPVEVEPPPPPKAATPRRNAPKPPAPVIEEPLSAPPPPPPVGLGSEVALLQSAKGKLDAGDWASALSLLDQHHAQFPEPALSIEADVLRVLAWCGDGHHAEASELAARLRERAPRAPATARLSGSCVEP